MLELENTTYNEETDGPIVIVEGIYPAHVAGLEGKELDTKAGKQMVFNLTFLINEKAADINVSKMVKNEDGDYTPFVDAKGNKVEISADYMVGKRFNSTGIWLTPSPSKTDRWKNRKYLEVFRNIGIEFPTNSNGDNVLAVIEEEDVIGRPCLIQLQKEHYEKDGEKRFAWKAFDIHSWADGTVLSEDEVSSDDIPF
tara:strand:+ start:276 stop:866 length:591 start_codon:yes stop_codon:yes gene_type:complete